MRYFYWLCVAISSPLWVPLSLEVGGQKCLRWVWEDIKRGAPEGGTDA